MKTNIDLTQNRLFSREHTIEGVVSDFIRELIYGKFPWSSDTKAKSSKDCDFRLNGYDENELIFTGNAKERASKNRNFKIDTAEMCERCEFKFAHKPWLKSYSLCFSCAEIVYVDVSKKWRKINQQHNIQNSNDRIIIEMNKR